MSQAASIASSMTASVSFVFCGRAERTVLPYLARAAHTGLDSHDLWVMWTRFHYSISKLYQCIYWFCFLFHLLLQNVKVLHLTNFLPRPSTFNPWNNAECIFISKSKQSNFKMHLVLSKGEMSWKFLWLSPFWQFLAHNLSPHEQLQHWASLTPNSSLWHTVEGKWYCTASLAGLKIWEQTFWLFSHWMQTGGPNVWR